MAVWVFLIIVAVVGAAAVLLYQRTSSGPDVSSPDARSPGRLAQRVEESRGPVVAHERDEFVDSQAAVWAELPVVEPRSQTRDEFFDQLPYADEHDDDEVVAVDVELDDELEDEAPEPERRTVVTPTVVVTEDDEDVDRFAPRSSYVRGLAEEDELAQLELGRVEPQAPDEDDLDEDELPVPVALVLDDEAELDVDEELDEAAVAADGTKPLARRTPKAGEEAYRRPLRLAQTTQRPSGANRRSPDQVRSMLANYRSGLSKGRSEPVEDE